MGAAGQLQGRGGGHRLAHAGARAGTRGPDVRQRPGPERSSRPTPPTGSAARSGSQAPFDSDDDGKLDRIHADFTRAGRDRDRRPEGPGHLRGQPVLRRHGADATATGRVDHELGARRPSRPRDAVLRLRATRARRSARSTSRRGCRAASPSCTPSRPARATPTAARPPAAERDARRDGRHRLAQRPRARPTRPATGRREARRRLDDRQGRHDGHVLQRHDPRGRRDDRRRGPGGDRPDLGDLRLVRLLPRQRHGARAALARPAASGNNNGFQGEDLDVLADVVYSRIDEADARARSASRRSTTSRRTSTAPRATATRSGTSATT